MVIALFLWSKTVYAQKNKKEEKKINIVIKTYTPKDSVVFAQSIYGKQNIITDDYKSTLAEIKNYFYNKGYLSVNIDSSILFKQKQNIYLYIGEKFLVKKYYTQYKNTTNEDEFEIEKILDKEKNIELATTSIVNYFSGKGFPFITAYYDSIYFRNDSLIAHLSVDKKYAYYIKKIELVGNLNINNKVLYKLIKVKPNDSYIPKITDNIEFELKKYNFIKIIKPVNKQLLINGANINIYAANINKNKFDAIVGLNQTSTNTVGLTVDANIILQNAFAKAEKINISWQQLQPLSPRIILQYNQPFILNSNMGLSTYFSLYKKDSNYININYKLGTTLTSKENNYIEIGYEHFKTNVLNPDTNYVIKYKKLPNILDAVQRNIYINYSINAANKYNLLNEDIYYQQSLSVGVKNILNNSTLNKTAFIQKLYDSINSNSYNIKTTAQVSKNTVLYKNNVYYVNVQAGAIFNKNNLQNELFQLGGFKTIRGFNEENIFASKYLIVNNEYRLVFNTYNYFFSFIDAAYTYNNLQITKHNSYISFGGGLALNTKQGLLKINLALGKENTQDVSFKNTKLHIGIINNL